MVKNTYYVRPKSGVWFVYWNDAIEPLGSYACENSALEVARLLAKHTLDQGGTSGVQVEKDQRPAPAWRRTFGDRSFQSAETI